MSWRDEFVEAPFRPAAFGRRLLSCLVRWAACWFAAATASIGLALICAPPMELGGARYVVPIALFGAAAGLVAASFALREA